MVKRFFLTVALVGLSCSVALADCEQEATALQVAEMQVVASQQNSNAERLRCEQAYVVYQIRAEQYSIMHTRYYVYEPWNQQLLDELQVLKAERAAAWRAYQRASESYRQSLDAVLAAIDMRRQARMALDRCRGDL